MSCRCFFQVSFDVIASSLGTDIPVRSFDVIFTSLISIFFCASAKPDEITLIKKKAENVFMNSSRLKTNDKRYTTIRHPFVDLPEVLHLALSEPILNTVSQFYGCFPALTGGKVHRTHANKGPKKGTQLFHIDKNSLWFIKAFSKRSGITMKM